MRQDIIDKLSEITEEERKLLSNEDTEVGHYSISNPVMIDSAGILNSGKMIGMARHSRFVKTGLHRHNYIEMMFMYKGQSTHIVNNGKEIYLKENEIILFNQHALHYVKETEMNDIGINIIIRPEFFDMALELFGVDNNFTSFLIDGIKIEGEGVNYLHFKAANISAVQTAFDALVDAISDSSDVQQKSAKLALALLLSLLSRNTQTLEISEYPNKVNAIVADALSLIENSWRNASIKAIALKYGVAESYVSRLIKNTTGKTFKSLLVAKRMAKTAEYLQYSDISIQDICFTVGYENISHFYHMFEYSYGCSPAVYRKKYKSTN